MPFITEEIWQLLSERKDGESIMVVQQPAVEAYDEAIQKAEKLAYDLDATTEMDLREIISNIGPKEIAEAADESLEEISQALTDFRMVSEDEYIEQMIPLAEEIQRRGLLEVKDNGIPQYPYARTVVEDVEDYRIGENRASNNSAIIDKPRDLQMTEGEDFVEFGKQKLKQQQLLQKQILEIQIMLLSIGLGLKFQMQI